jgi:hypothetical protein
MSTETAPRAGPPPAEAAPARRAALIRNHGWSLGALALALAALGVVRWANTRPGFDPYGWLVWGHQTLAGALDTNAAPSWKPLPYLFTLPYALAGHFQLWLWMVTSVGVSLSGMVFAARIAYRLVDAPPGRRWAGVAAAIFAAFAVNLITQYWHYILSDQSDPMIVSLCLGAIDCGLSGRPRWAFALGVLGGLGRPEVWAFMGLYTLWAWRAIPSMRGFLIGGWVVTAALWFGIPAITSRSPFVSADNAFYSGRRLHHNLVFGTIGRLLDLLPRGLEVGALVSVGLALWRRDRVVLGFAGAVVIWTVVEIAFVIHGWPGVPRYMFEVAGLIAVIAAIGVGRLLVLMPRGPGALRAGGALRASGAVRADGAQRAGGAVGIGGMIAAVAIVASVIPPAVSDARIEHHDIRHQRLRTRTLNLLTSEIDALGGPGRFRRCGEPLTRLQYQSAVAWSLRRNVSAIGFKYGPAIASRRPIVLFTPYPQSGSGWHIQALHQRLACRSLPG